MKQKKLVSLLLILVIITSIFVEIIPTKASAATLTPDEDGWYQISTADELVSLSQSFTYYKDGTIPVDAKIKLMADIDMEGVTGFQPIGDNSGSNGYFQGEFDGNGYIISNLTIEYTDDWSTNLNDESASLYVGFFGYVSDGYIHDLGLVNVDFTSSIGSTGGIVGMMVGGTLENSFVTGQVKGTSNVGGLIGRMRIAPVVKNNYAFVDVIGNNEVGGLVGTLLANEPATVVVENNLHSGFVDAMNGTAGGLFGTIAPIEGNIIKNNMVLAESVTGSTNAGAFSGTEPGVVLGTGNVVLDSMTVGAASITDTPSGVAIKDVVDFSEQETYSGWDYTNIWTMVNAEKGQYPILKAFISNKQPMAPWLIEKPLENDATGYTAPPGGGESPTSVTYLWDSFGQPKGQYSARFNWVTSLAFKDTVLYYAEKSDFEKSGKFSHRIVGTNKTVDVSNNEIYDGTDNISLAPVQSHKVETHTLKADTEYVWVVGNGKHNVYTGSFKTPAANVNDFEFIWISDAQTNGSSLQSTINNYNERAKKAIDLAVSEYPDAAFILSTGDQVNYTFDTWEWDAFFSTNQKVFEKYPLYLMPGNHEYNGYPLFTRNSETIDPSMSTLKGRFNAPKNGAAYYGGGNNGTEPLVNGLDKVRLDGNNYYFIYGDTLFMVMENVDNDEAIAEQVAWMKSVVKNNPTKWRVASLHISLFPGYRDQPANFQQWTDGMDAAGVDLVLMGHEHLYLRTKLINDGKVIADQQAYGEGTTYITNSPATNAMGYFYSPRDYTEVAFDEFGSSYAGISITPDEIRITAKGYDSKNGDELTVEDDNTLITNKPRTPNLSSYEYPAAVDPVPAEIYEVTIGGVAKEDQSLLALTMPRGATASYQWQVSPDGKGNWADISGADKVRFTATEAEVGSYLRVIVNGIDDFGFGGSVISPATKKVEPLRSDGVNDPGYTLDLSTVQNGGLPAGWVVDNNATVGVATTPDGEKAVKVVNSEDFVVDIPFGPQRQVFDISYSLYVETNGTYPEWNDRYYSTKLSFLDSLGEPVAWNQPMTWGDTGGQFYWNGSGGFLGFKAGTEEDGTDSSNGYFVFTDNATAGKWFTFVYSFDFTQGTYTVTVNGEPVYVSPSLASDTFIIPPASSEITSIRLEGGLSGGSNNHLSESVYYYKDIIVGDGGLVDVPKEAEKIYNFKNYKTGKLIINKPSVSITLDEASVIKNGIVFTGDYAEFHGAGFADETITIKPKKAGAIIDFKGTEVEKVIIDGTNVAEIRGAENIQNIEYVKGANPETIKFIN